MESTDDRLRRCIRDLAALNALPSMCIGRSPREVLDVVLDALPTALNCDLVYLSFPGSTETDCGSLRRVSLSATQVEECRARLAQQGDEGFEMRLAGAGRLYCVAAEIPIGADRGRLLAGRTTPLGHETDRVLIRAAANLTGTTLESAHVLDVARRKDEFLAMLGHELRNPLAPILTAVELLARHPAAAREQQVIERQTRHLSRLVDDLLDIARIARGHLDLRRERVSLQTVLQGAVEIASPLVSQRQHTLTVGDASGVMLEGDPVRLAQIFGNLLTNAAKYTDPWGSIEVVVERTAKRVAVAIRDSGRGLAPDQLTRVFEPFVRVHREHDTRTGGLGLGLAIVRNLVDRHGGSVTAHSEGVRRGSTFRVELPTVDPVAQTVSSSSKRSTPRRGGIRVLVVDDNQDIADLLAIALGFEGFETAVAYDAESALARWPVFRPDAAVLDVGMPKIDGYQLARSLRGLYGSTPTLVAATGFGQPRDRALAEESGFDRHFVKPVSVQQLASVIEERVADAKRESASNPFTEGRERQ